jgi:dUTP pyrophosphatase
MATPLLRFRRLPEAAGLPLPAYATDGAAGFDLRAAVPDEPAIRLVPGARLLVPAGFAVAIPAGFELQIRPRSGLAVNHGVTVLNSPGTIDSDYRGALSVCLVNLGEHPFQIRRGDRIAQAVVAPAPQASIVEVEDLDGTVRGVGGFGSTGVR